MYYKFTCIVHKLLSVCLHIRLVCIDIVSNSLWCHPPQWHLVLEGMTHTRVCLGRDQSLISWVASSHPQGCFGKPGHGGGYPRKWGNPGVMEEYQGVCIITQSHACWSEAFELHAFVCIPFHVISDGQAKEGPSNRAPQVVSRIPVSQQ